MSLNFLKIKYKTQWVYIMVTSKKLYGLCLPPGIQVKFLWRKNTKPNYFPTSWSCLSHLKRSYCLSYKSNTWCTKPFLSVFSSTWSFGKQKHLGEYIGEFKYYVKTYLFWRTLGGLLAPRLFKWIFFFL